MKPYLLLLSGIITAFLACGAGGSGHGTTPSTVDADSLLRIKFIFVGDIMGHGPQITSALDSKTKKYDYVSCFKYIKPIIEKADVAVGNLELTLPGKGPYTGYPMFRSPDTLAYALKDAGFDMLMTVNNHSNDGGLIGITHTIDVLDKLNIKHTGTFKDQAEKDSHYPLIVKQEKNGKTFKFAVLGYTYDTNGIPDHKPSIVNLIDTANIRRDVKLAKATKPDAIIVVMHWGLEYQLEENPVQRELADFIEKLGVTLLIGSHPHVVQPVKSIGKMPVVYSLGNFISNQKQDNTDSGLMYEVELVKNTKTGKVSVGENAYIPVWRAITLEGGKSKYYTIPASAIESDTHNKLPLTASQRAAAKTATDKTRKRLEKHDSKERKIDVEDIL